MKTLTARERRHKAVIDKIARLTLARNKGIKAIVAAETQLPKLERQARRYDLPVKPRKPKPAVPLAEFGKTEVGKANRESWNEIPAVAKAKRKPRAKTETPTPQAGVDVTLTPEDRERRMESMGFRRTKRKGSSPNL